MAKYNGIDMLLKIETTPGGGVFATIGASSSHTLTFNNEQIDASDKDSSRWKELIAAGDRSLTISMEGIVSNDANFAIFEDSFQNDTILNYQLVYGNSQTIEGAFHIDSCEISGERNNVQRFSATLTNSGAPTFT